MQCVTTANIHTSPRSYPVQRDSGAFSPRHACTHTRTRTREPGRLATLPHLHQPLSRRELLAYPGAILRLQACAQAILCEHTCCRMLRHKLGGGGGPAYRAREGVTWGGGQCRGRSGGRGCVRKPTPAVSARADGLLATDSRHRADACATPRPRYGIGPRTQSAPPRAARRKRGKGPCACYAVRGLFVAASC